MEGLVPNCGLKWSSSEERRGRLCEVPKLRGNKEVQKCRRQSFQMAGPKLWNSLPKNVRNVKNCGIEQFKEALDNFLSKVPDEPKTDGLTPGATDLISGRGRPTPWSTSSAQCAFCQVCFPSNRTSWDISQKLRLDKLFNIYLSLLVRLEGKHDFEGNRDFQTLNLGFPGHFDRFWVFQK